MRQHPDRVTAFRARHSPGETIRGRVLEQESAGLYWIDAQGCRLLAPLGGDPRPGTLLTFSIAALWPEIVLRLVQSDGAATPADLAAEYLAARYAFEDIFARLDICPAGAESPADRIVRLTAEVRATPAIRAAHRAVECALAPLGAFLASHKASLAYLPFHLPDSPALERLAEDGGGLSRLTLDGRHPEAGSIRLAAALDDTRGSYRVAATKPGALPRLLPFLEHALREGRPGRPALTCLGMHHESSPPPPLLAPYLGLGPRPSLRGLTV